MDNLVLKRLRKLTISDVAQVAGVSTATVSLALNGRPGVAAKTRKRIIEIAQKLDYQPNAFARGLVLKRTQNLGLIVPDITSQFYAKLIQGVEEEASRHGFCLTLVTSGGNPSKEKNYIRLLQEQRVDGLLIVTPRDAEGIIEQIHTALFPLVVVDRDIYCPDNVVEVLVDNFHGAFKAVEHLIKLGYRNIGFINGIPNVQASQDRLRGYKLCLDEHGIGLNDQWIRQGYFTEEGGYHAMQELLSLDPPLEAVFAGNDLMAIGAIKALRENGKQVPHQVAIVGFDDIPLAAYVDPPLTTVHQPITEMGIIACRLLLQQIQGKSLIHRKIVLQTKLVVRASCGALKRKEVICDNLPRVVQT